MGAARKLCTFTIKVQIHSVHKQWNAKLLKINWNFLDKYAFVHLLELDEMKEGHFQKVKVPRQIGPSTILTKGSHGRKSDADAPSFLVFNTSSSSRTWCKADETKWVKWQVKCSSLLLEAHVHKLLNVNTCHFGLWVHFLEGCKGWWRWWKKLSETLS